MYLRLTGIDRAGNEYSTIWMPVDAGTTFDLLIADEASENEQRRVSLRLPAAELQLPLDHEISGIRLWSIDAMQRSDPARPR